MGTFNGKVAFITGAARGQGRNHAIRLAAEGAALIAVDVCRRVSQEAYEPASPADLADTVELVKQVGGDILAHEVDVRDGSAMQEVARAGAAQFGGLDIVVANAGVTTWSTFLGLTDELWQDTIDINVTGVYKTLKATVPLMIEYGQGGSIVITSSVAGIKALPGLSHYTTSKHAVVGLMKAAAIELAQHGIRVNTVNPWQVKTHMGSTPPIAEKILADNPSFADSYKKLLRSPDVAIPDDISDAVLFLVSSAARTITGVVLPVDAGASRI